MYFKEENERKEYREQLHESEKGGVAATVLCFAV